MDSELKECGCINSKFRNVNEIINSIEVTLEMIINISDNSIEGYKSVDERLARYEARSSSELREEILPKDTKDDDFEDNYNKKEIGSWLVLLFGNKIKSIGAFDSRSRMSKTQVENFSVSHKESGSLLGYKAGITTSINNKLSDGTVSPRELFLFNNEDIDMVYFIGLQDVEEFRFRDYIDQQLKEKFNK